ncbi:MAG: hypothetical protein CG440_685 [Methanosaeta sp. NSM2]|nr:hypothetical protein [Methanothrix sp.]OYV14334.1 MAG: hypothetical protein CG440_685 [Methanosaeta sp. NSM2]
MLQGIKGQASHIRMFLGKKKPSSYRKPFFPADPGFSQDLCKEADAYLPTVRIGNDYQIAIRERS